MTYEPQTSDLVKMPGNKQYLPAAARVQWMRGEHPDWSITTDVFLLDWEAGFVVMRAEVIDETGRVIGQGTKTETRKGFADFVEKAETGAVARALARAGYGTEDALDLEGERLADAPIEQPAGGERGPMRGGAMPAMTRPPTAARTPEVEALRDRLLAAPLMTKSRMSLLADAVGIVPGQRATLEQWQQMVELAETPGMGVPPPTPASGGGGSVPPPRTDTPSSEGSPGAEALGSGAGTAEGWDSALQPNEGGGPTPPGGSAAPTLDDVLAMTGGELLPPRPGTPEYKELSAGDKARTRAYWQKHPELVEVGE